MTNRQGSNLPDLLATYYGQLDFNTTRNVNAQHETGDLHIAVYDYGSPTSQQTVTTDGAKPRMMLSVGRVDAEGAQKNNER